MNILTKTTLTAAAGVIAAIAAAAPASASEAAAGDGDSHRTVTAPAAPAPAGGHTHYLINNNDYHNAWGDDGVKGQIKNFTNKTIVVTDRTMGASRTLAPHDTVIFYADTDLRSYAGCGEGDGTRFEIAEKAPQAAYSQFWLSDSWIGRPDAVYSGPHNVQNVRENMREGESHHEIAGNHKFWIKRENDSWKTRFDNWNTSDWAAFTIHVDSI